MREIFEHNIDKMRSLASRPARYRTKLTAKEHYNLFKCVEELNNELVRCFGRPPTRNPGAWFEYSYDKPKMRDDNVSSDVDSILMPWEASDTDDPVTEAGKNKDRYKLSDGIEVMDLICKAGIGVAEGFCRGNIIKYIMRAPNSRTPAEDYAKAEHYARMLKNLEKRSTWRSEEEDNAG